MVSIVVDAMGGDRGPDVIVPGALRAMTAHSQLNILLVGQENLVKKALGRKARKYSGRIQIVHAEEVVAMNESPASALRNKKNSSMRLAIDLVKTGAACACVSAGNTGALMATARFVLKMIPGIDRPAISAILPTSHSKAFIRFLDLGANVDCTPEHLFQFAIMGSVIASLEMGIPRPSVGLLNVGAEEIKGNRVVKQTAEMLEQEPRLNYIGFVEGHDVYQGACDVVVCDGFVGNVMLKASEGVINLFRKFIREEFKRDMYSQFAWLLSRQVLNRLRKRLDPSRYNGACLLGLQGIVVKSHGGANVLAVANAVINAYAYVQKDLTAQIDEKVQILLNRPTL